MSARSRTSLGQIPNGVCKWLLLKGEFGPYHNLTTEEFSLTFAFCVYTLNQAALW